MKKYLISIIIVYFLIMLQRSFLTHFFNFCPNLVFIFIIFLNLLESRDNFFGIYFSLISGFLLDIFSVGIFGYYLFLFLLTSFFIKIVIKDYVQFNLR